MVMPSKGFAKLSSDEIQTAGLAFVSFFLIMVSYYVLKATRSGIFLASWGPEYIPHFLIMNALVSFAASGIFGYLADRFSPQVLVPSIMAFFSLNLVAFWTLFKVLPEGNSSLAIAAFYTLWLGFFSLFTVTPFWSLINSIFKTTSGKLIFGFIGAGGTLGTMAGSQIASSLAELIGSENLLLFSALPLALLIPCIRRICRHLPSTGQHRNLNTSGSQRPEYSDNSCSSEGSQKVATPGKCTEADKAYTAANEGCLKKSKDSQENNSSEETGPKTETRGAFEGFFLIKEQPYVMFIALIVVISTFSISAIDYNVHSMASSVISDKDHITSFFAHIYFNVSLISIVLNVAITPLVLNLSGMRTALLLLPAVVIVTYAALLSSANLDFLSASFILILALHYSINQTTKELLYIPCEKAIRYKAKSFIDTFGYRLGPVLSAGFILLFKYLGRLDLLTATVLITGIFWIYIVIQLKVDSSGGTNLHAKSRHV